LCGESLEDVRAAGFEAGVRVAYKVVDTCAAEFAAATPYYYSTYEAEDESPRGRRMEADNPSVLVLGSGPIRIGQGIEFDYCSVQAAMALREGGWSSAMLNSNPETVSTDFDTSDRLYFDPLDEESAENVVRAESAHGVVVQFGGQTAINLAEPLARRGITILGSSVDAIDLAEDRRRFEATLREIGIPQPPGAIADRVGYPVLVRPSYVLGGRAMEIVHAHEDLEHYLEGARDALARGTILIDKYLVGGEFEVDAICDGERVLIPGIMEHVERAGVHSGDSFAVYPPQHLTPEEVEQIIDYTRRIALRLKIVGLLNIQYVLHRNRIYVIEVNPRSSRTVPFLSKITSVPMVPVAMAVMMGRSLRDQGYEDGLWPETPVYAVKAPVFSMSKLLEVDSQLGPEMKSTGEVMGIDTELPPAMFKAFLGSLDRLPREGVALCTHRRRRQGRGAADHCPVGGDGLHRPRHQRDRAGAAPGRHQRQRGRQDHRRLAPRRRPHQERHCRPGDQHHQQRDVPPACQRRWLPPRHSRRFRDPARRRRAAHPLPDLAGHRGGSGGVAQPARPRRRLPGDDGRRVPARPIAGTRSGGGD